MTSTKSCRVHRIGLVGGGSFSRPCFSPFSLRSPVDGSGRAHPLTPNPHPPPAAASRLLSGVDCSLHGTLQLAARGRPRRAAHDKPRFPHVSLDCQPARCLPSSPPAPFPILCLYSPLHTSLRSSLPPPLYPPSSTLLSPLIPPPFSLPSPLSPPLSLLPHSPRSCLPTPSPTVSPPCGSRRSPRLLDG